MSIGWVLHRDWVVVDQAFADELSGVLAFHRPPAGSALALVARSVRHAPGFVLRVVGHPVVVITESYDGNDGAIDTSGTPGGPGLPGRPASALSVYALAATNVRLIARGGAGIPASDGRGPADGGDGALVTFRALAPTGIQAPPELFGNGGAGTPAGATVPASISWYTGSSQWRSDVEAALGGPLVAHAAWRIPGCTPAATAAVTMLGMRAPATRSPCWNCPTGSPPGYRRDSPAKRRPSMEHPKMFDDDDPALARVRRIALALPEALEKVSHGRPAFFTRKVFAYYGGSQKVDGQWVQHPTSVMVLADLDGQSAIRALPHAWVPGYLGPYGWTGLDLGPRTDWDDVAGFIEESYRFTATARLIRLLDASPH